MPFSLENSCSVVFRIGLVISVIAAIVLAVSVKRYVTLESKFLAVYIAVT
jgi:hypothetical protein